MFREKECKFSTVREMQQSQLMVGCPALTACSDILFFLHDMTIFNMSYMKRITQCMEARMSSNNLFCALCVGVLALFSLSSFDVSLVMYKVKVLMYK